LMLEGKYEDVLERQVPLPGAGIVLSATLWRGAEKALLIMEVRDNGLGLLDNAQNTEAEEGSVNGRGFSLISRYSDSFFIGEPGGCLIILKTLEGGHSNAD